MIVYITFALIFIIVLKEVIIFLVKINGPKHGQYKTQKTCYYCQSPLSFEELYRCCSNCGSDKGLTGAPDYDKKLKFDAILNKWLSVEDWDKRNKPKGENKHWLNQDN